jgi:hypothetical protein
MGGDAIPAMPCAIGAVFFAVALAVDLVIRFCSTPQKATAQHAAALLNKPDD